MNVAKSVDARGLTCPMPIIRTKKGMDSIQSGEVLELLATDKGSLSDVEAWARNGGHELLDSVDEGGVLKFYIKKA